MIKNDHDYLARQLLLFRTFLFRRCPTLPLQGLKSVISLFAGNKKARQAAVSPNNTFALTAHNKAAKQLTTNPAFPQQTTMTNFMSRWMENTVFSSTIKLHCLKHLKFTHYIEMKLSKWLWFSPFNSGSSKDEINMNRDFSLFAFFLLCLSHTLTVQTV